MNKRIKYIKIGKKLRDLVMRSEYTYMFDKTHCDYFGEFYTFEAVTKREILGQIEDVQVLINEFGEPWYKKLFKTK